MKRAEKKVDRNVLLAAAATSASAAASANDDGDDDSSSQSLDWWDGFSRRISGISFFFSWWCRGDCALAEFMVFAAFLRIEFWILIRGTCNFEC